MRRFRIKAQKAYRLFDKTATRHPRYTVLYERHGGRAGGKRTRLYNIWTDMKNRCYYPGYAPSYKRKGIQVCDEWRYCFPNFKEWALTHGYQDNLTIDRIDNNGDYCPDNCRWISLADQQKNKDKPKKVGRSR